MSEALIKIEDVTKKLSGEIPVTLVNQATLTISGGEFVVINGPSGSGKSSLLYLLGLLDIPTTGRVWIRDQETTGFSEERLAEIRLQEIGFVFQFHFLLPEFSALENVMLPMKRMGKLSEKAMKERANELLTTLGLKEAIKKRPRQLSGGQSQRVAIARALANNPRIILADEPTGNLDTQSSDNVQEILQDLSRRENHAVVAVTHDLEFAKLADRVVTIVDGRIQP